jgi:hypothetical protein
MREFLCAWGCPQVFLDINILRSTEVVHQDDLLHLQSGEEEFVVWRREYFLLYENQHKFSSIYVPFGHFFMTGWREKRASSAN